jgi:hypothetical protein
MLHVVKKAPDNQCFPQQRLGQTEELLMGLGTSQITGPDVSGPLHVGMLQNGGTGTNPPTRASTSDL